MTAFRSIAVLTVPLACLGLRVAVTRADAPPPPAKLKTQKVSFKIVREDWDVRGLERTIELVQLPAGTIRLPDPDGEQRERAIKPIWMAKYETRWDEYDVFWLGLDMTESLWRAWLRPKDPKLGSRRYHGLDERPEAELYMPPFSPDPEKPWGVAGYPANCIHFQAAVKYCAWLSKTTGHKFRLPTEAEWEYACRAGGPPLKPDPKALRDVAWFEDNSNEKPHPVGQKQPNAWGLYDMLGNVAEYVVRDPKDDKGLAAGGSFEDEANDVHSGAREPFHMIWGRADPQIPKSTSWYLYDVHHLGFRVVMEE